MVTNDDGISSIGLHVLARTMRRHGDVVVVAPDTEYSGAGAALGPLHLIHPQARRTTLDGVEEAWTVNGPPALCTMFARFGVFGPIDLVVSGINPGANVGRAVYHSGTVGAALTARNGRVSGVAISQSVSGFGVEGQAWDEAIAGQHWESAAEVGRVMVQALLADMPTDPVVVNVNVPDVPLEEITSWKFGVVGNQPPRSMAGATLDPVPGHDGAFHVNMSWGDTVVLDPETDGGIVERGQVAVTYLTRLVHEDRDDIPGVTAALGALLTR